eukprot:4961943-Alexandrium_andersonii.AAC.1
MPPTRPFPVFAAPLLPPVLRPPPFGLGSVASWPQCSPSTAALRCLRSAFFLVGGARPRRLLTSPR